MLNDVYDMKTDKGFLSKLQDNIRQRGAMKNLISNRDQAELSNNVKDLLRALFIYDF